MDFFPSEANHRAQIDGLFVCVSSEGLICLANKRRHLYVYSRKK